MARGFGSGTFGVASTDSVDSVITSHATLRSYSLWLYHTANSNDNTSNARLFDKNTGSQVELLVLSSLTSYTYFRQWSGGIGQWDAAMGSHSVWHNLVITYDAGSASNDPVMILDGSSVSVTETQTPSGSVTDNADKYIIGNRQGGGGGDRGFIGILAEFAIWDGILTVAEAKSIYNGRSPLNVRPSALVEYIPMVRSNVSLLNAAPTLSGTAVQTHPRIGRLRPRIWRPNVAGAAPPAASNHRVIGGGWGGRFIGAPHVFM